MAMHCDIGFVVIKKRCDEFIDIGLGSIFFVVFQGLLNQSARTMANPVSGKSDINGCQINGGQCMIQCLINVRHRIDQGAVEINKYAR